MPRIHWMCPLLALVFFCGMEGCNGSRDELKLFQVSGTVTFNGQPVPYGSVNFVPDTAAGNSGPQGSASIRDGKFDTRIDDGRGTVGGAMIAIVSGRSNNTSDETQDQGVLFQDYELKVDLPKSNIKLDIEVPDKAGPAADTGSTKKKR